MANTYTRIYLHIIFAVHDRENLLRDEWRDHLFRYIYGACEKHKHHVYALCVVIKGLRNVNDVWRASIVPPFDI